MRIVLLGLLAIALRSDAADGFVKRYQGGSIQEILKQPDVGALPVSARLKLLEVVAPQVKSLSPQAIVQQIRDADTHHAANGRVILSPFVWSEGCTGCGHVFREGAQILVTRYGPLTLGVNVRHFEKYLAVLVLAKLAPDASGSVDILPDRIELVETAPDFALLKRIDIPEVAKAVRHGADWRAALISGFGGMATKTVTVQEAGSVRGTIAGPDGVGHLNGSYSGTKTVVVPDDQARRRAREDSRRMIAEATERTNTVTSTALLATSLGVDQVLGGFLYFKQSRRLRTAVLRIPVGNVGFEFPLVEPKVK